MLRKNLAKFTHLLEGHVSMVVHLHTQWSKIKFGHDVNNQFYCISFHRQLIEAKNSRQVCRPIVRTPSAYAGKETLCAA